MPPSPYSYKLDSEKSATLPQSFLGKSWNICLRKLDNLKARSGSKASPAEVHERDVDSDLLNLVIKLQMKYQSALRTLYSSTEVCPLLKNRLRTMQFHRNDPSVETSDAGVRKDLGTSRRWDVSGY